MIQNPQRLTITDKQRQTARRNSQVQQHIENIRIFFTLEKNAMGEGFVILTRLSGHIVPELVLDEGNIVRGGGLVRVRLNAAHVPRVGIF